MPLPIGLDKVTLTGTYEDYSGNPLSGTVRIEGPTWLVDSVNDIVFENPAQTITLDNTGSFSVDLVATDATGVTPTGFLYQVIENVGVTRQHRYYISLPKVNPTVDISELINISDFL